MKLKITQKDEQLLLQREKIVAEIEFENAVPARQDVLQQVAKTSGVDPSLVVVMKIDSSFGSRRAEITSYVYKTKKALDEIEEKKKLMRTGLAAPKPAETQPAEVKA